MTDVDPFAVEVLRNGRGNPMIVPLKRKRPDLRGKPIPYTRVSTFAKALDNAGGLIKYNVRSVALGLGRNPDLAKLAGVYGPTIADLSPADKSGLDAITERAHDRVGGNAKADYGTAIHALTEPDRDPFAPADMQPDVAAYAAALERHGIVPVSSEQFVVCDELQVAGTFDHAYKFTRDIEFDGGVKVPAGTVVIGDKKTGGLHFVSQAIQLAVYAHGSLYDAETGERTGHGASLLHGVLAHIPKGEAVARLYLIDLAAGWAAAKLAGQVRALTCAAGEKSLRLPFPVEGSAPVDPAPALVPSPPFAPKPVPISSPFDEPIEAEQAPKRDVAAECAEREAKIAAQLAEAARFADELAQKRRAAEDAETARIKARAEAAAAKAIEAERAETEQAAAISNVVDILGAEPVLTIEQQIDAATCRDELAAIWRANQPPHVEPGVWTAEHTARMRAHDAETKAA
jgi:hypothetical protein